MLCSQTDGSPIPLLVFCDSTRRIAKVAAAVNAAADEEEDTAAEA
jgi:hypothetical protein